LIEQILSLVIWTDSVSYDVNRFCLLLIEQILSLVIWTDSVFYDVNRFCLLSFEQILSLVIWTDSVSYDLKRFCLLSLTESEMSLIFSKASEKGRERGTGRVRVRARLFFCVTRLFTSCDILVCHDSFVCVAWGTHSYVTWIIHMCHDSFICATRFVRAAWLVCMCDVSDVTYEQTKLSEP